MHPACDHPLRPDLRLPKRENRPLILPTVDMTIDAPDGPIMEGPLPTVINELRGEAVPPSLLIVS